MKHLVIILFTGLIFSSSGNNPWITFDIPSNANDLSLSRSNTSMGAVGFYQFTNPALLPKTKRFDYGLCYNMMSLDRSTQVISFNFNLPPKAGIGLSIMRSGTSNIQGRDIFNNDTYILNNYDILGMISFGVLMNKYISAGMNIKASYSNLDNIFGDDNEANYSISSKGIGIDAGVLMSYSNLSLGMKIENIKSSKNWNLNLGSEGGSYDEDIPVIYKIGTHYRIFDDMLIFYVAGDNSSNSFSLNKYAIEIINIKKNFGVQGGVLINSRRFISYEDSNNISPTLGFYYLGEIWNNNAFKLNYGVDFGSVDEGISHIFTWTFTN